MSLNPDSTDRQNTVISHERERLYSVFQQAPMPVAILRGPEFVYELSNPANQRFLGDQEVIGKRIADLKGVSVDTMLGLLEKVYSTGERFVGHAFPATFYINGEPQLAYFDFIYQPIRDADGKVDAILTTATDVTDVVLARNQAREQEARFRRLLDVIPQIVWSSDSAGKPLYFNRKWWEYTGLDAQLYRPENALEAIHPDDQARVFQQSQAAYEAGTPFEAQYRLRAKDGSYRWHLGRLLPVKGENGVTVEWFGTATDIDDLAKAQSRFQAFFEQSSLPMEVYSLEGAPLQVNGAWVNLFETNLDQLQGYNVLQDPQIAALGITPLLHRAIQGEAVEVPAFYYDPTVIGKSGRPRWLESTFFPVKDGTGSVQELAMILRDVTDRKSVEQVLRETNEQLEHAVRARQDLLNICGHELKTPLSSLRLQTQTAKRRIAKGDASVYEPERVQKLLESYGSQIDRLIHLVDDMLDLTRISSGRLSLNRERIVLSKTVLELLDRFADQIVSAGCSISTSLAPDVSGDWDRFRVEQVLTNLIANALKYAQGTQITVAVAKSADGKSAVLSVKDTGPGIASEHQERIFHRFERAVSADEVSGLGLGLFIAREIVTQHGGSIRVESRIGEGAAFIVELPLAELG